MSATAWRGGGARQWRDALQGRKPGKADRKPRKAVPRPARQGPPMTVRIEELPAYRVAYVRHVGPYGDGGISALWAEFERWIRAHGLRRPGTLTIGIGHDAPSISAPETLRYDACLVVDAAFKPDRRVNIADLPGGKYAVTPFEGPPTDLSPAWERFWMVWLPGSGYQPEERPCLELRPDFEGSAATNRVRCQLCLPIAPL